MATINIEVWCACGEYLYEYAKNKQPNTINVEPCERCLAKAYDEGRKIGYEDRDKEEKI